MIGLVEQITALTLAVGLSSLVGFEREKSHKPAGIRTNVLVCLTTTFLTMASIDYFSATAPKILAGIITGMGFVGAGTIIASGKSVHGLTSAASLLAVAAIGIGIGLGYYILSITLTVFILATLLIKHLGTKY
jgi:putative Mg2+ transporter-C (MgtC) family protein